MAVAEEMSQSPNPKDTQALLQSMLQRLKLQPGKEGQADLHTPVHTTAAPTWGQDGERGASTLQKVSSGHVNGFEFGTNGVPSKEFGFSAADSNHCLKDELIEKSSHGCEVDRDLISFPSQKDNTGDMVGDRVSGQAGVTLTGPGQLFPDQSPKDADITSFERTGGVKMNFGSSAITRPIPSDKDGVTRLGQNENQDQSFKPKVYAWSSKPTDTNLDTQSLQGLHVGNGGFGAQSKDMQVVSTNSSSRRKSQSSESKTRKWTQKIKEKWRDRPGSFGKKEKDKKNEQGDKNSVVLLEHRVINTSKEEESSDPSDTPTHTVDNNKECMRPTSDFDFGLGSFSLLDEIVTGQEWANFLNQSATSADHRQSQLRIPPNPHDNGRSSLMNQPGGVNTQLSFTGAEESPDLDFSMAQISPDAFQAVSMDVSEGKNIHRAADQSEPMEHGHTRRSSVEPAALLNNSARKGVHLSRKRQHQSAQRRDESFQTEKKEADGVTSVSLLSQTRNHVKEERDIMPLYTMNSPSPSFSPSSPFAPAPRGVLKHSISRDSQISMETVTKRRRVEENRRVHFSEQVVAIAPPELNLDALDLEEDWGEEEDSVIEEQECEEKQAEQEEVAAAARRPALPAWIQALKRMNAGRKHRF